MNTKKLQELIKEKNLTMYALAKASGVPESSVGRIVHGISKDPNVSTVKKIADALGVKVDDLLQN